MKCKPKKRRLKLYFLKMLVLFEAEFDQFMIVARNENVTHPNYPIEMTIRGLLSTFKNVETIIIFTYPPYDTNT